MTVTVLDNQSLLDIAIQTTGKAENYLAIARLNGLVPTEPIIPGTMLTIPEGLKDEDIVKYYTTNNVLPATGLSEESIAELIGKEGIGYWILENDFKVS